MAADLPSGATRAPRDEDRARLECQGPGIGFVGYVLRFEVERPYAERYEVQLVGGEGIDALGAS